MDTVTTSNSIIKSSVQYVLKHGLKDLSMRNLSTGINTSARMLVHYFGSAKSLFDMIVEEFIEQEKARATKLADQAVKDSKPLESFLKYYVDALVKTKNLGLANTIFEIYGTSIMGNKKARECLNQLLNHWLIQVERVLASEGVASSVDVHTVVMSFANGIVLDQLATGDKDRIYQSIHSFSQTLLTLKTKATH